MCMVGCGGGGVYVNGSPVPAIVGQSLLGMGVAYPAGTVPAGGIYTGMNCYWDAHENLSCPPAGWSGGGGTSTVKAANKRNTPGCRYVDPLSAGVELTGKIGPAIEVGDFTLGASVTKIMIRLEWRLSR